MSGRSSHKSANHASLPQKNTQATPCCCTCPITVPSRGPGHQQQSLEAANQNAQIQEEGTIPGLYYDPSDVLAPTFANSQSSETAGSIRLPAGSEALSFFNGAWPANTTSDQVLKIGLLKHHPQFKQFMELNINQVFEASGKDSSTATLAEVPITSFMTLGEYLQINPGVAEQSLIFLCNYVFNFL